MVRTRGGDKLKRALDTISAAVRKADRVEVGFFEDASYPNGTPVAAVAAYNEYGNPPTRPPRPFFRCMVDAKKEAWPSQMHQILLANNYNTRAMLEMMGELIKAQLVQSINEFTSPPLAPSTIARKGFDKPLIDTGLMLRSVAARVIEGPK